MRSVMARLRPDSRARLTAPPSRAANRHARASRIDSPRRLLAHALDAIAFAALVIVSMLAPSPADAQGARPKVMIVVDEKVAGMFGTTGWETIGQAESTLASRLSAAGFTVIDAATVKRNISRDKALKLLDGDDRGAALAGLQFGAQIVITGQAISKNAGGRLLGTSMQTLQATVHARAIWSDSARVIATHTAQASKAHIDEMQGGVLAIREASDEVAEVLSAAIVQQAVAHAPARAPAAERMATVPAATDAGAPGATREVTLMISGLVSFRHLDFVQQFLERGLQGVRSVELRQFAGGTAELAVDYAGQSPRIARDLANQKFTGFRLEPTSVTPNRLDIRAVLER